MTEKRLLRPAEIACEYGIPKATQTKLRMNGDFAPFIKRGRSVFVRRSDLDQWLLSLTRSGTLSQETAK